MDHGAAVVLISGGPGTGKTSTVVELLRRVVVSAIPDLRIGLAAPDREGRPTPVGCRSAPISNEHSVRHPASLVGGCRFQRALPSPSSATVLWSWISWWWMRCRCSIWP